MQKPQTLSEIVSLVEQVTNYPPQRNGDGFKCRCPSHEDDKPSLSIRPGDKQPWILKCFAGCSYETIIKDLGIATNGVNGHHPTPPATPPAGNYPIKKKNRLGKLQTTYVYHDKDGNYLFEKRRYQDKEFRVKTGPKWGLGKVEPVPYNLDLIANSDPDTPVYIVEGEKDADNLVYFFDCIATCNFDGASSNNQKPKWNASYNQWFADRPVIIIPDNDEPGRAHAENIAKNLAPVATSVKVVSLPNLTEKQDFTDWLKAGGHPAELERIVDSTEARPKEKPKDFNLDNPKTDDFIKGFQYLGYQFRLNVLDDTLEINGHRIDDVKEAAVRSKMYDLGFKGVTRMQDAMLVNANHNSYHPIKEYLATLEHDGKDHIQNFVDNYLEETTGFGAIAFKRWLVGAVAKVFDNEQNFMLVWDGGQDVGKSTLARWLCPLTTYYIEGQINPDDKDCSLRLCTKWVWEVPEVDATTKRADVAALKDFITKQEVTVRRAYGKYDMVKPALASLIGTINSDGAGFLRDKTGNRRFVTIYLKSIDFAYTKEVDPARLWAQAVQMWRDGETGKLTKSEKQTRDAINSWYEVESFIEILFNRHFVIDPKREDHFLTSHEILETLETYGLKGSQRVNLTELKVILTKAGAKHTRKTLSDGSKATGYSGVISRKDLSQTEAIPV